MSTYENFQKAIAAKRTAKKEERGSGKKKKPSSIICQRVHINPSGKLQKYEPMEAREFVPYDGPLTLEKIKGACELHYRAKKGSCDILFSDRGPSCSDDEQLCGKKIFMVRFLESSVSPSCRQQSNKAISSSSYGKQIESSYNRTVASRQLLSTTSNLRSQEAMPKSVSMADILNCGRLVKPKEETAQTLILEHFDVQDKLWVKSESKFRIEKERFAEGGFRDAYLAYSDGQKWVVKKFKEEKWQDLEKTYNQSLTDHTRKQVQMHGAAKAIATRFSKQLQSCMGSVGELFTYDDIYYSVLEEQPVTVEHYIAGDFHKYLNNNGIVVANSRAESTICAKAEALCHFSYHESGKKLMLLDMQGVGYHLADPEIATSSSSGEENASAECYFCAGNLRDYAIESFCNGHQCNVYCTAANLPEIASAK